MKLKIAAGMLPLLMLSATGQANDLPKLVTAGEYTCQVSKEYKFRKCRVVDEGKYQVIDLYEEGHLLNLRGVIYPSDFVGKTKQVFAEVSITNERPYICTTKDEAVNAECRAQKIVIPLQKKGNMWVGTFPLKYYWDDYAGEGADRKVVGHVVTIEPLTFKLKLK